MDSFILDRDSLQRKIPNYINNGMFVINFSEVKHEISEGIEEILNSYYERKIN